MVDPPDHCHLSARHRTRISVPAVSAWNCHGRHVPVPEQARRPCRITPHNIVLDMRHHAPVLLADTHWMIGLMNAGSDAQLLRNSPRSAAGLSSGPLSEVHSRPPLTTFHRRPESEDRASRHRNRTRSSLLPAVSAARRNSCTRRRTSRRRWASSLSPDGSSAGRSASIEVP